MMRMKFNLSYMPSLFPREIWTRFGRRSCETKRPWNPFFLGQRASHDAREGCDSCEDISRESAGLEGGGSSLKCVTRTVKLKVYEFSVFYAQTSLLL